ncbi:ErmE/ErmH/ErmO/ErmR family 23S rRNA (adenine(2058)-N(6))-methyltransferase [Spirillospora sp. NPDC047279]|uniref:ErmE/ErmH/ErmO/ErmR family 23S rRNA (adenine(2058)-N(6))-methyltransferase n=1 Tax=Spirillospora sp. NPDC047279 TaxID=3155478 RepID=UPI0033DF3354
MPHSPSRHLLSQNFLVDATTIRRYARSVGGGPGDLVVEVGAGDGRLTAALAAGGATIHAHEIDPRLAGRLRARDLTNVHCHQGDFLRTRPPERAFRVAGNIPYSVTSGIVGWCLRAPLLTSATLITQLEYARKRTGDYGRWSRLTVETWPAFGWHLGGRIHRSRFRPVPRVDSAVLHLDRRAEPLLPAASLTGFRRCVELGFSGKGGSLHASLRTAYPRALVDAGFRAANIDRAAVVAYVHPDQWIALYLVLSAVSGAPGRRGRRR